MEALAPVADAIPFTPYDEALKEHKINGTPMLACLGVTWTYPSLATLDHCRVLLSDVPESMSFVLCNQEEERTLCSKLRLTVGVPALVGLHNGKQVVWERVGKAAGWGHSRKLIGPFNDVQLKAAITAFHNTPLDAGKPVVIHI